MANKIVGNPLTIDTTGTITTKTITVQSVTIVGSSDAPTVVLTNTAGDEILRYVPAAATVRNITLPIGPTNWIGLIALTLTNVTRVFINQKAT